MALSVGTKGSAPGSGYAGLPEEPGAEGVAVQSKGFYIGKGIKSAARCGTGDARNAIEGRNHPVSSLAESLPHSVYIVLRTGYGGQGCPLGKGGGAGIGIDHEQLDTPGELRMHNPVTNPPAGHGIGFGKAVQNDGAVLESRDCRDGIRLVPVDQSVIDLIRQDHYVGSFPQNRGQLLYVPASHQPSRGVAGIVEDDQLCPGRDACPELFQIDPEIIFVQKRNRDRFAARKTDAGFIDGKTGVGIKDFIAGRYH